MYVRYIDIPFRFANAYILTHSTCAAPIGRIDPWTDLTSSPPSSAPPIPLWTRFKISGTLEGTYHMIQGVVGD